MIGQTFGRLKVVERAGSDNNGKNATWICECQCGSFITTTRSNLIQNHTKSCGCILHPPENEYEILQKQRFLRFVRKTDTCWIWLGSIDKQGYGCFNDRSTTVKAHRWSYKLFKGSLIGGPGVCHTCDNPICVNPDHLYLGTPLQNAKDKMDRNRWGNPRKRYTDLQIEACLCLNNSGFSSYEISELLNISVQGVLTHVRK